MNVNLRLHCNQNTNLSNFFNYTQNFVLFFRLYFLAIKNRVNNKSNYYHELKKQMGHHY